MSKLSDVADRTLNNQGERIEDHEFVSVVNLAVKELGVKLFRDTISVTEVTINRWKNGTHLPHLPSVRRRIIRELGKIRDDRSEDPTEQERKSKFMSEVIVAFTGMMEPYINRTVVMKDDNTSEHMSHLLKRFNLRVNEYLTDIADRVITMLVWEEDLTDDDTELLHCMVKDLHAVDMINRQLVLDQGLNGLISEILGEDFT